MSQHDDFQRRIQNLHAKHARDGTRDRYVARVRQSGTVRAFTTSRRPSGWVRSATYLTLVVAAFIGFKSLTLTYLGEDDYAKRLAMLEQGTQWEQMTSVALRPDAATELLTYDLRPRVMTVAEAVFDRIARGDLKIASSAPIASKADAQN